MGRPVWFTEQRWLALWAAMLGYMLDALDVLLYVFAVQTLRTQFHWSAATAGLVSSATLLMSSVRRNPRRDTGGSDRPIAAR